MRREPEHVLTVGPVPGRKGWWLGVEHAADPGVWVALAKFRSEEAANEFLKIASGSGWTNGDGIVNTDGKAVRAVSGEVAP